MIFRYSRALVLALIIGTTNLLPWQAQAENLSQALSAAYTNNPDLAAARAGVRQSFENAHIANASTRPQVNFSGGLVRNLSQYAGNWQSNDQLSATVSGSLLIYDGGNSALATDAALARARVANLQLQAQEQQVLLNTVGAYLNVLQNQSLIGNAQNNINSLQTSQRSAQVSFDAGSATITDVAQSEAAVAQARSDLSNSQALLAQAQAQYKALTGLTAGSLQAIDTLPPLPSSLDAATQIAMASSPLIKAAIENERAAQFDLRRAKNARAPQVNLNASGTRANALDGSEYTDSASVGINVNVPLYNGGQISATQRQAQAALEARVSETNATRANIRQNVTNSWAQLQNANASISALQQVVQAQQLADEGAAIEYEIGSATITERLNTQQNLLNAQTNLLNASYQRQLAVFQVYAAMGKLTVEGMGLGGVEIDPLLPQVPLAPQSDEAIAVDQISDRWVQPAN